ncbi:TetR/AcrR family transcriptional regulator [Fundicoccus culcitae]|uniref:TetR/AcrR family transcriptional regulator n=1 Tax=Fundicoccus culcitae TaxID=2969821 RepID=A0ABY5P529_9LACT|nr:TetR/AcrR family transcriptional regulator [Fundicoccus culcitae]UUX33816.1 TetR/AcrR family transcriptional regulator [Fundicoccus culcitae]
MVKNTYNQEANSLTKESLQIALLKLLKDYTIEEISVTQLTQEAGVSRMAYYRNYESMEGLHREVFDRYFMAVFEKGGKYLVAGDFHSFWNFLFQYLYEDQVVITLIRSTHTTFLLDILNQTFCNHITDINLRYSTRAMIGCVFNMLTEWIDNDFNLPPKDLADLCMRFTIHDLDLSHLQAIPSNYLQTETDDES